MVVLDLMILEVFSSLNDSMILSQRSWAPHCLCRVWNRFTARGQRVAHLQNVWGVLSGQGEELGQI